MPFALVPLDDAPFDPVPLGYDGPFEEAAPLGEPRGGELPGASALRRPA